MRKRKVLESFGDRLARIRRERGFTQEALAQAVGLGQPNISDYERGAYVPNATMVIRFAQVLGVSTDTLLGFEPVRDETGEFDPAVLKRLRKIKDLSRRDRVAVLRTLDAFLERGQAGSRRRVRSG